MKYIKNGIRFFVFASPSTRREWIEIVSESTAYQAEVLSPSTRREWIEIPESWIACADVVGLPPRGGSGLKYSNPQMKKWRRRVSLHAEGVD